MRWAVLAFGLSVTRAMAADHAGQVMIFIGGERSCGSWNIERERHRSYELEYWVSGFLTAYNTYVMNRGEDIAEGTDNVGFFGWIDNYCQSHPLDKVWDAAMELIRELDRRRIINRPQ